ncbi:MAG: aminotransferase class V-fold PLP-dependent enzyme [Planctomycetota bacterium]
MDPVSPPQVRDFQNDEHWIDIAAKWSIRPDTVYLNHGSFGPSPMEVRYSRHRWIRQLDEQPMDFYVRGLEVYLAEARQALAEFVGTESENLLFADNATYGMNVVADSFPLKEGDEVLLNDHEYGAVHRIWDRSCNRSGAVKTTVNLPSQFDDEQELIDCLLNAVTPKTKLLVISHITSATALILPVDRICAAFAERNIPVCIDGPHAPAHVDFNLNSMGCAFYTASCHKWLCAPLGSGFLFVAPEWQKHIQPLVKSWGRLLPAIPEQWDEEFIWQGTRDPSVFLAIPDAIKFMRGIGIDQFRGRTRTMADYAEKHLMKLFGTTPLGVREKGWYGSMAHVPLPENDFCNPATLQHDLWEQFGIEIPVIHFADRWFIRVSSHLYNSLAQIDTLIDALRLLVMNGRPVPGRSVTA